MVTQSEMIRAVVRYGNARAAEARAWETDGAAAATQEATDAFTALEPLISSLPKKSTSRNYPPKKEVHNG